MYACINISIINTRIILIIIIISKLKSTLLYMLCISVLLNLGDVCRFSEGGKCSTLCTTKK